MTRAHPLTRRGGAFDQPDAAATDPADAARRDADDQPEVWYVVRHNGPCSDHRPATDPHGRDTHGARPERGALGDVDTDRFPVAAAF